MFPNQKPLYCVPTCSLVQHCIFLFDFCFCQVRNRKRPIPRLYTLRLRLTLYLGHWRSLEHDTITETRGPYILLHRIDTNYFGRGSEGFLGVSVRSCRNNPHFSPMNGLLLGKSCDSFNAGKRGLLLPSVFPLICHSLNLLHLNASFLFHSSAFFYLPLILILSAQHIVLLLVYHPSESYDQFLYICIFSMLSH